MPETFFLTVFLFDKALKNIELFPILDLEIIGLSSFFVACKY